MYLKRLSLHCVIKENLIKHTFGAPFGYTGFDAWLTKSFRKMSYFLSRFYWTFKLTGGNSAQNLFIVKCLIHYNLV